MGFKEIAWDAEVWIHVCQDRLVAGFCEHGNELSASIKCSDFWLLKDCTACTAESGYGIRVRIELPRYPEQLWLLKNRNRDSSQGGTFSGICS
jgi:hypothetical protein